MSKVAIVGCGVFGAAIALRLQRDGHSVTVFERLQSPLQGASLNNQNRLHLGYHYPRDLNTARQCIKGFSDFKSAFPQCLVSGFKNAYFIASENSQTSPQAYMDFCNVLNLNHQLIDVHEFSPVVKNVALGILTEEIVYDSRVLGELLRNKLEETNIIARMNTEITDIKQSSDGFLLKLGDSIVEAFDYVINATYASISRLGGMLGLEVPDRQYEYTAVPIIKAPFQRVGVTIMDGSFMTVLPFGKSENHLLYHVDHTVIARSVAKHLDQRWLEKTTSPFASINQTKLFDEMKSASLKFLPSLADAELVGFLHGPRMVLAKKDDTDARPSIIENPILGYYSVFSGKIDHCMWIAEELALRLSSAGTRTEDSLAR